MVTPYAASSSRQNVEALEVPQGDDKIIVSIHAYLPYSFALDTAGTDQVLQASTPLSQHSLPILMKCSSAREYL